MRETQFSVRETVGAADDKGPDQDWMDLEAELEALMASEDMDDL